VPKAVNPPSSNKSSAKAHYKHQFVIRRTLKVKVKIRKTILEADKSSFG
jgi:hypothetical protein